MAEVFLEPADFQEKVDSYETGAGDVKGISFEDLDGDVRLACVDRYRECIAEFNEAVELFGQLLDKDTASLQAIKSAWMHADESIADKTFGDLAVGFFQSLPGGGD